jgi:16S rRNA (uracil1498-N3)-methyltransferase
MPRFFCPAENISGNKIVISDRFKVRHIRGALRLKPGEEATIFDGAGFEYTAVLEKAFGRDLIFKIKGKRKPALKKVKITLACAIPKQSRMDDIVDKLTQLGLDRIIPLCTSRVVAKIDREGEIRRLKRWQRIAQSASEQSRRSSLPEIDSIKDIREVLSRAEDYDLKLIPTLTGKRKRLKDVLAASNAQNILILIGPEGDFTDEEIELAKGSGCVAVSLGGLVLRVETAAIAIAGYLRLQGQ